MKTVDFQLAEINIKETKSRVEEELEKYRLMLLTVELHNLPRITASYSLVPPSNTNKFYSSTEDAAVANVDYQIHRKNFMNKMIGAVNRLTRMERAIIIRRYMSEESLFDYEVAEELNLAVRTYQRYKSNAIYRLAFALNIVVYEEREVSGL